MVTESILNSIKKMLGIERDFTNFDPELIMHINSVFVTLCDLGVGPEKPYAIEDACNVWGEFATGTSYQNIKTYIYLRVRLLFDPPSNSFAVSSFSDQIKELEWRLNVQAENHCCKHCSDHFHKPGNKPGRPNKPGDGDDTSDNPSASYDLFIEPKDGKLPEVGEPNKIYIIPNGGDDPNFYDEYFWNEERQTFEFIGSDALLIEDMTSEELENMWNNVFKVKGA